MKHEVKEFRDSFVVGGNRCLVAPTMRILRESTWYIDRLSSSQIWKKSQRSNTVKV